MGYTVGQVAKMIGVAPSTLRYYESVGLLRNLGRTDGGQRVFSDQDVETCRVIGCLKASGLSIKDIEAFMEMVEQGDASLGERLALFEARRAALAEEMAQMQAVMDVLDYKCWYYSRAVKAGTADAVRNLPPSKVPQRLRAAKAALEQGLGQEAKGK